MCILFWTLPKNDHPRYKFALASNRDEFLARHSGRATLWPGTGTAKVGILAGQDLQTHHHPPQDDNSLPGTWLGMTTEGDLVALTNYLEAPEYYVEYTHLPHPHPPSRGAICSEFLTSMVSAHHHDSTRTEESTSFARRVEHWIRTHADQGWETKQKGMNLLVVQNGGDLQCIGTNREGSEVFVYDKNADQEVCQAPIATSTGTAVGVSNSVFSRPWPKVKEGSEALERVLNKSLVIFGTGDRPNAVLEKGSQLLSPPPSPQKQDVHTRIDDDSEETLELAWIVLEMFSMLRIHTKPYPESDPEDSACEEESEDHEHHLSLETITSGFKDRIFVPPVDMDHLPLPHTGRKFGTRSSTVVLFARHSPLVVFVEKEWYSTENGMDGEESNPLDADSTEGVVWWQGRVGQPPEEWRQIQGQELDRLFEAARSIRREHSRIS